MMGIGETRVYLDGARNGCVGEPNLGPGIHAPTTKRVRNMGVGQACERLGVPVVETQGLLERAARRGEISRRAWTIEKGIAARHEIKDVGAAPAVLATSAREFDELEIDRAGDAGCDLAFKGEQVRKFAVKAIRPDRDARFRFRHLGIYADLVGASPNAPADDVPHAELATALERVSNVVMPPTCSATAISRAAIYAARARHSANAAERLCL
jgi:hypothetical protein